MVRDELRRIVAVKRISCSGGAAGNKTRDGVVIIKMSRFLADINYLCIGRYGTL